MAQIQSRLIKFLIAGLLFVGILLVLKYAFLKTPLERLMKQRIEEINKSAPSMIDKETRLDSVALLSHQIFGYYYTLVNHDRNTLNVENLKKDVRQVLLQRERSSSNTGIQKNYDVTISYLYRDRNGDTLFNLTFSPADYKK